MATLLLCGLLLQSVLSFAPASLLPVIIEELGIDLAGGGLLISVVCLIAAVIGPFSGYLIGRYGVVRVFALSMGLVCAGSLGSVFASGFLLMLACRILFGAGFGVALSLAASAFVEWFPPRQRSALNSISVPSGGNP